jgi:hypothetical protein
MQLDKLTHPNGNRPGDQVIVWQKQVSEAY